MNPDTRTGTLERRKLLQGAASVAGFVLIRGVIAAPARAAGVEERGDEPEEAEVTPGEDLMQEHGVLERILLVYDEAIRRIEGGKELDSSLVARAAEVVRRFIQDYHEKQEEQVVFPRLRAAQREVDLVAILVRQHERGRQVTEAIGRKTGGRADAELAGLLASFGRMYRPHAAREDTVLFPAFRDVVGRSSYRELGEQFEHREHELFGEDGFEKIVERVATIEKALGIYELEQFTPRV